MKMIKKIGIPSTDNSIKEGLRLALVNAGILLIGGGITLGLFYLAHIIRRAGFPLPLPVWLITIGIGVPCFMIWFHYGKSLGHIIKKYSIRGITIAILGDIPGLACVYLMIKMLPMYVISQEIHRIIFIILAMLVIMMPIMILLGILDAKKAEAKN